MTVAVSVLAGGVSLEREISLRSGRRVTEALDAVGHDVTRLDVDDQLVHRLLDAQCDAVYLALHGKAGEDGTVQSLLEVLGVPYTGPDAVASALAWDKGVCKGLLRRHGAATPDWVSLSSDAVRDMGAAGALEQIVDTLGMPVVVKPAQGGASMGVRVVHEASQLPGALVAGLGYGDVVLVERFVGGTEIAVSIVEDEPLPAVEVIPRAGTYDYAARYTHGATEFHAPARVTPETKAAADELALSAWNITGCRNVARADLIVDAEGQPWFLELDTCPGMTETSLLPLAAHAAGESFSGLCDRILAGALDAARAPVTTR
ncbi:MAG: D-alanine--D-alanine ligase family protein [Egibacteraceae bacterium]